ncbi:MAG: hypothetical protein ACP5VF_10910 [Acidobacteriota bacterium]
MKKKRVFWIGLFCPLILATLIGCGHNKHLEPQAELILQGASPPTTNVSVNPPTSHLAYFIFRIQLTDQSLSMIPSDSWTIDSYEISYDLLSDPGHHLIALPDPDTKQLKIQVTPGVNSRVPVTLVTDTYLRENAMGFLGTSDTATIKAQVVFRAHRNKDGYPQTMKARYIFNIGNY